MARDDCDICGGTGFIFLYPRERVTAKAYDPRASLTVARRQYPCPECNRLEAVVMAETATYDLTLLQSSRAGSEALIPRIVAATTARLTEKIINEGLAQVEVFPPNVLGRPLVGSLRVSLTMLTRAGTKDRMKPIDDVYR